MIKEFFASYTLRMSDITCDIGDGSIEYHNNASEPWKVTLIDTGEDFGTGGRLKKVLPLVADDPAFHFTYGDGVGCIDIGALEEFHQTHGCLATVTATRPLKRFGLMKIDGDVVYQFDEKPEHEGGWVNGGFFVLSPDAGTLIADNRTYWEAEPMQELVNQNQLRAFLHHEFWQPMDTLRDRQTLEQLWASGAAPWKTWN